MAKAASGNAETKKVTVSPRAYAAMALHAAKHPSTVVHGALVGRTAVEGIAVTDAVPVCHETPTKTILDASLAMIRAQTASSSSSNETVVGWYTAPELMTDKPDVVALRTVANLSPRAVLLVIDNETLGPILKDGQNKKNNGLVKAYGRDFGDQWMQHISQVSVEEEAQITSVLRKLYQQPTSITDFVDHLEADPASSWFPNDTLARQFP